MVQLVPMNEEAFGEWLERFVPHYGQGHVRAGRWSPEEATRLAREEIGQVLTEGVLTKDHYFYALFVEGEEQPVGMLWFGVRQRPSGRRSTYVYNIEIYDSFRRRGYASDAFRQLEKKAQELGVDEIALHVFGQNHGARALYEKLGYEVTNLQMAKPLRSGDSM